MNFARAWHLPMRLIRLVTGVCPYKGIPGDRLQAAREELAMSLKPDHDYWRRHLAHISPERVAKCKRNMESRRG